MDYKELLKEDSEIILDSFMNKDAFILGKYISEIAISKNYAVAIRIIKNNNIVFEYLNDNALFNNFYWIEKKINVVKRFDKSSALIAYKLKSENLTFDEKYGDAREYAVTPGAVPIRVKSVGTVGIISVSGLSSEEDHGLIIKGLKYLLSRGDE